MPQARAESDAFPEAPELSSDSLAPWLQGLKPRAPLGDVDS